MPIHPLPQFEADLKEYEEQRDRELYERLKAPTTIVVRYGSMKMIGEFPYDGDAKPGCGSKIVVRSFRGVEMGEMLTSTCPNSGCSKSVTRQEMLEYIENSGGRQYPFSNKGKAMRVATKEDMDRQAEIEQSKHALKVDARDRARRLAPKAKVVEVEPILSLDRLTVYYTSEDNKVDTHALQRDLQGHHKVHVEMRQVGARDEARLTADYERCGQYCCCKNFLKVLKPVSMRSAKVQKATLDPLKISGRCGRLMCCLRYEDETYETLRKRLPKRKKKVGTPEGDGIVVDTQILTQLVLVELDGTRTRVAVPVEELTEPTGRTAEDAARDKARAEREAREREQREQRTSDQAEAPPRRKRKRRRRRGGSTDDGPADGPSGGQRPEQDSPSDGDELRGGESRGGDAPGGSSEAGSGPSPQRKKRRRRRRRRSGGDSTGDSSGGGSGGDAPGSGDS